MNAGQYHGHGVMHSYHMYFALVLEENKSRYIFITVSQCSILREKNNTHEVANKCKHSRCMYLP